MNADELRGAAQRWMAEDPDAETRAELEALLAGGDAAALEDRFGSALAFGTAGLRGVMGAGPNRMNRAVVQRTTAALARFLKANVEGAAQRGVVVGYDGRRGSKTFSVDVARALAGEGVKARVFAREVPTPLVAFAVKHLGAAAGVMVTASHNPPEYNGYKVYWDHGAQIVPPVDAGIAAAIASIGALAEISLVDEPAAREVGLYEPLGEAVESDYLDRIRQTGAPTVPLTIAYTAMHGVGDRFTMAVLQPYGDVYSVPEQAQPDGRFPTVRFPNPEEPGAMDLLLALAAAKNADLAIANDPDADRMAAAVPDGERWRPLTGNEVGALLGDHLMRRTAGPRVVATTIVSSPLLGVMAAAYGAQYVETLTGFKWIAHTAIEAAARAGALFLFGYEEALGYAVTPWVRDKDGVSAALLLAALASELKSQKKTLLDRLEEIYATHGLFVSAQHNVVAPGAAGQKRIADIMAAFRARPVESLGGRRVVAWTDFQAGVRRDAQGEHALGLPPSDVLRLELDGGSRVMLRPSGTEPKIKYYFDHREPRVTGEAPEAQAARAAVNLAALRDAFLAEAATRDPGA
ncbi:MAG: phosphoglucomutase/phosphomannomutase [Myxococcaceae bacterium]|nr:phosphoglucomutase/phosphomannomutase [Myxococcaceae bacterium]